MYLSFYGGPKVEFDEHLSFFSAQKYFRRAHLSFYGGPKDFGAVFLDFGDVLRPYFSFGRFPAATPPSARSGGPLVGVKARSQGKRVAVNTRGW
jgi:hypothetical protein